MKTVLDSKQKFAAALLGLAALMTGCGRASNPGTIGSNGQPVFPGPGVVNPINGCAPVTGPIPFAGQVRVSPLTTSTYTAYGFTHPTNPSAPAPMVVGGAPILSGGSTFMSTSAAGSMTLAVAIQHTNVAYQSPAQGSITLSQGGLAEIQSAFPMIPVTQLCVAQLGLFVTSTQGNDLVGPLATLCVRPISGGAQQVCGQLNF